MHPDDARALAALIGELRSELKKLEENGFRREDFFSGELAIQFPFAVPGVGGRWVELRVVSESQIVEDAEQRRTR
jgi:hypothetical protein